MTVAENELLQQRLDAQQRQSRMVQVLFAVVMVLAIGVLLWTVRLMRVAWSRALRLQEEHQTVAHQLRVSLDSLSQGVAVFDAGFLLSTSNHCFQQLLDL